MEEKQIRNRRKMFYDDRTKLIFGGYIVFTAIIALFLVVKLLTNIGYQMFSPGYTGGIFTFNPGMMFFIFVLWTIFGYFFAYAYAVDKIHGIIFRMGRLFERIADKEIMKLTFRKDDPFHPVADSFNKMLTKLCHKDELRKQLESIAQNVQGEPKKQLEKIIGNL